MFSVKSSDADLKSIAKGVLLLEIPLAESGLDTLGSVEIRLSFLYNQN